MTVVTLPKSCGVTTMRRWRGIMAKAAVYTEADLRAAFICGVKHGQGHNEGDPEPQIENWIDCLFYQGFLSDTLFNRPGYADTTIKINRQPVANANTTLRVNGQTIGRAAALRVNGKPVKAGK